MHLAVGAEVRRMHGGYRCKAACPSSTGNTLSIQFGRGASTQRGVHGRAPTFRLDLIRPLRCVLFSSSSCNPSAIRHWLTVRAMVDAAGTENGIRTWMRWRWLRVSWKEGELAERANLRAAAVQTPLRARSSGENV